VLTPVFSTCLKVTTLALLFAAVAACSEKGEQAIHDLQTNNERASTPHTAPAPPIERIIISEAWIGGLDLSVKDLIMGLQRGSPDGREAVVIGRVVAAEVNYDSSIISHDSLGGASPPPDDPKAAAGTPDAANPKTGVPFTHTTVKIERVIYGPGLAVGDAISISQIGELRDGVSYETKGDPLIKVDNVYLIFAYEPRSGTWVSHPVGRFEVGADSVLRVVDPVWERSTIANELAGLNVDEASASIEAVAALAVIPEE
jgi:hypothetical protein